MQNVASMASSKALLKLRKRVAPALRCVQRGLIRFGHHGTRGAAIALVSCVPCFGQLGEASDNEDQVDFAQQIIPIITQAGCNSGACHGAAAGRGYLSLSLFGSRPQSDYETLLFASPGRFIDLEQPESSLLLQKPGGYLDHGGGVKLDVDEAAFKLLRNWIENGAPRGTLAKPSHLTISPSSSIECTVGEVVEISATSDWRSGDQQHAEKQTVTPWLAIGGAQPMGAENSQLSYCLRTCSDGQQVLELTPLAPGYWPVSLRLGAAVQTVQLWVRPVMEQEDERSASASEAGKDALGNNALPSRIDAFVMQANRRVGSKVADTCAPHLLARRLWIDLLGRHPNLQEWQTASEELRRGHKTELVDRLMASDDFRKQAGTVVASWVTTGNGTNRPKGQLAKVIAETLSRDDNLQQLVRKMLRVDQDSPSELNAFHQFAGDPRTRAELVASTWMGVRLGCAQCHDHPLDHWTQDDYFAMAACWANIDVTPQGVRRLEHRSTTDLRTGRAAIAKLPGSAEALDPGSADEAFVQWLCGPANPQFASNLANRLWLWLMGSGLVEDVDDQRSTNPAINPELLRYMATALEQNDFSLDYLVREIVLSDTYARATRPELTRLHQRLGASRPARSIPLALEELLQGCIVAPLESLEGRSDTVEASAMMAPAGNGCSRGPLCQDPFSAGLDMVAGEALNELIEQAVGWELDQGAAPDALLDDFHRRLFGTDAARDRRAAWRQTLAGALTSGDSTSAVVEDILWTWIVSDGFRLSH